MTTTSTPPSTDRDGDAGSGSLVRGLIGRLTRLELVIGGVIAAVMVLLVFLEPEILEAPFENERTMLFTVGGTALAVIALVVMLWLRVPAAVRVVVLVVPFAIVNWWLLSPYFIDDVVDDEFSTSIAEQLAAADEAPTPSADPVAPAEPVEEDASPTETEAATDPEATTETEPATETEPPTDTAPPPASEPVLLGAGQFVGLAGHSGTGDAGIFQNADGSLVLRFENFDIQNGPDLEVYLVPGADQTSLADGSVHLGALRGNIGDQNYTLPPGTTLDPGAYTALVWCEAFSVEFVGATISV